MRRAAGTRMQEGQIESKKSFSQRFEGRFLIMLKFIKELLGGQSITKSLLGGGLYVLPS